MFSLFFFCKQKTAYEMRISDWSSDVCSSDRPPGRHVVHVALNVHVAPAREIGILGADHGGVVGGRAGGVLGAVDETEQIAVVEIVEAVHPIGRASCRERVCQYV